MNPCGKSRDHGPCDSTANGFTPFYPLDGLDEKQAGGEFVFGKLDNWSQRPEPAIRHFSGTARHRKTFEVKENAAADKDYYLDLGKVSVSAKVRLNGRDLGVVWCAPWRLKLGDALQPGENLV